MNEPITNEQAFEYHKATGCPLLEAKRVLSKMEPLLLARVLEAVRTQNSTEGLLYDPLEDDPKVSEIIKAARATATALIKQKGSLRMGSCHEIWREQARILREEHGVVWFSPQKMNPRANYD